MLQILESPAGGQAALVARVGGRRPVAELPGPAGALVTALRSMTSAVKIALWTEPASALHAPPGVPKTAAWTDPLPLAALSDLARATGTSVNDVAVTLVAGAVARWLADHGRPLPPDDDDLAWMVPVNLEPPGAQPPPELGNHFALVLAVLPHGAASFRDRLAEVHRRITAIRGSWEPVLTSGLARAMAVSPSPVGTAAARLLTSKAVGVLTNVPGPRERMTLAGAPVAGRRGLGTVQRIPDLDRVCLQLRGGGDRGLRHRRGRRARRPAARDGLRGGTGGGGRGRQRPGRPRGASSRPVSRCASSTAPHGPMTQIGQK
jgi:hypothetical protein